MTFRGARLRLTAWYALIFSCVLLVLGAATFVALTRAIDRQLDSGIDATMTQWLAGAPQLSSLPALEVRHGDEDDGHEDEVGGVFLLALRAVDGVLVDNPRDIPAHELLEHVRIERRPSETSRRSVQVEDVWVRVHVAPIVEDGRVQGALVGGRSLTERDAQVRTVVAVLGAVSGGGLVLAVGAGYILAGRALRPLAEAHRRQQLFVGDASHELRTPITIVRTSADLMLRDPTFPGAHRPAVEEIRDVADEAGRLVEQLLQLARMEQPPEEDAPPRADLAEVTRVELDRLAPVLDAHGTRVRRDLEAAVGALTADECARVVRALLENVVAHTPPGTSASVATFTGEGDAVLVVGDAGPGVDATERRAIFERFVRSDTARTPGTGTGLGLAIVAAIARRRGGRATATAAAEGGLRVEFRVPYARAAPRGD